MYRISPWLSREIGRVIKRISTSRCPFGGRKPDATRGKGGFAVFSGIPMGLFFSLLRNNVYDIK